MNSAEMIIDHGQTSEELLHSLTEKYRDSLQHPGSSCKIVLKRGRPARLEGRWVFGISFGTDQSTTLSLVRVWQSISSTCIYICKLFRCLARNEHCPAPVRAAYLICQSTGNLTWISQSSFWRVRLRISDPGPTMHGCDAESKPKWHRPD